MTAIAILSNEQAGMWVATDGAAYTRDDGIMRSIVTKVILCPEWDCLITGRGRGGAAEDFRMQAQIADVTSFDQLVEGASDLAEDAEDQFAKVCPPDRLAMGAGHFTIVLCGFSRARGAFEIRTVSTRAGSIWNPPPPDLPVLPPFAVDRIRGSALFLPTPSLEAAERVGLTLYRGQPDFVLGDPGLYVQRVVAACRFCADFGANRLDAPSPHVGGFVQLSRILRQPAPAPMRRTMASR